MLADEDFNPVSASQVDPSCLASLPADMQNEILGRFDRGSKRSNATRSTPTTDHHASTVADNQDPRAHSSPPGETEVVADLTADQMSVGQEDGHPSGFIFGLEPLEDTRRAVREWMAAIACDSGEDARDTSGECGHAGNAPDTAHALLLLQLFYEKIERGQLDHVARLLRFLNRLQKQKRFASWRPVVTHVNDIVERRVSQCHDGMLLDWRDD